MVAPITNPEAVIGLPLEENERCPTDDDKVDARDTSTTETIPSPSLSRRSQTELEERVQELEEKLATLSLLLTRQRIRPISPRSITPPASPPTTTPTEDNQAGATPVLESPAPLRPTLNGDGRRRRNLSFRVLHGGDASPSTAIQTAIDEAEAERQMNEEIFLPQTLSKEDSPPHKSLQQKRTTTTTTTPSSPIPKPKEEIHTEPEKSPRKEKDTKSKWLDYLNSFRESDYDTDQQMEEFVKVPSAVESLLGFGFWICVDSFLYILTILPIRFVWSCLLLARYIAILLVKGEVSEGPFRFHRRHSYQLIQVSIIYIIYKFVLMPVSIGMLYHWIRGQAMVKLYVLIAMVEVFDRLLCSLGQDCLDSLYWNTTRRPRSSRLIVSVIVVLVYTMVHSFLLFAHLATLNVAMNSNDQALISLLIGGNFAEIKSTVFKKYNKATLFKITASDICERFKLALYLILVLSLNMSQGMDQKMVMNYFNMCGIVWCAEWLSDWVKHAFITKFNYISSGIYAEYALLLAGDVTGFGHEGVNLDYSHAVVKRIGFAQLPLVCVLARYLNEAFKYATYTHPPSTLTLVLGFFAFWSVLLLCKLSLGSFLHKISRTKLESAPEFSKMNASVAKKTS